MNNLFSHIDYFFSPIGTICLRASEKGLTDVFFIDENAEEQFSKNPIINKCKLQLNEYFDRKRKVFDVELNLHGTSFQKLVWYEVISVQFGNSISYLSLAAKLGNKNKIRAVANANAQNKIALLVPCHRVIGSSGELVGYSGSIWRKKWLLEHEEKIEYNRKQLTFFE
ncbi:MAG: methylated-DNA--[protein]-cysteine S-methyltransferase [Bacteroidota bacterium]|jgi:O-6-methylguanine DNA methyltransferase